MLGLIFYFSAQPSDDSTVQTNFIIDLMFKIYTTLKSTNVLSYDKFIEIFFKPVRKLAHFSEFALLGIIVYLNVIEYRKNKVVGLSILFSCLYAVSDEIHQLFVPGRACQLLDMCIDSCGAIFGVILVHLLIKRCKKSKQ